MLSPTLNAQLLQAATTLAETGNRHLGAAEVGKGAMLRLFWLPKVDAGIRDMTEIGHGWIGGDANVAKGYKAYANLSNEKALRLAKFARMRADTSSFESANEDYDEYRGAEILFAKIPDHPPGYVIISISGFQGVLDEAVGLAALRAMGWVLHGDARAVAERSRNSLYFELYT